MNGSDAAVTKFLAPTHWDVCGEAKDGAEAIQKAAELLPDLILLDVKHAWIKRTGGNPSSSSKVPGAKILIISQQ